MSKTLKSTLKQQLQERDSIEAEVAERSARLEAAGIGFDGKLVDREVLCTLF